MTFFYKRVFPVIWFGALAFIAGPALFSENGPPAPFLLVFVFMAVVGYIMFRKLLFDAVDEVHDDGDSLLLRNGSEQVRVNLRDIKNISYSPWVNPPRVTLSLRHATPLGDEVSFLAESTMIPFVKNKKIVDLIDRVDEARRRDRG